MSVGIAWRLVFGGVASDEDVESALREQLCGGQPFLRGLITRAPDVAQVLGRELPEPDAALTIDEELCRRLPAGAIETLLALPVGRDPDTGEVLVACPDPLDGHVQSELSFHLGEPVKTIPASLAQLLSMIPSREVPEDAPAYVEEQRDPTVAEPVSPLARAAPPPRRGGTPALGTPAVGMESPARPSERSREPAEPARREPRPSAPPIPLVRVSSRVPPSKPRPRATTVSQPAPSQTQRLSSSSPPAPAPATESILSPSQALDEIGAATSPEDVVAAVVRGALPVAARVLVFGVRGAAFVGRDAGGATDPGAARRIEIPLGRPSILKTASELGHYLGPIPGTDEHRTLSLALGSPVSDVSVHAAQVVGRAALVLVLQGFDNAYVATGRGEQLARAAGQALERLLRAQKR